MKLLLDEMISPAIARKLRARRHDVQAIKRDRPELESLSDADLVRRMSEEQRTIVTNNVGDFQSIHHQVLARGAEHSGMVFTRGATMPRNRASNQLWVDTLSEFLRQHRSPGALRNRVHHLP